MVAGAQDTGREAVDAVREVSDHMVDAIDELLKTRPYATLALAAGYRLPVRRDLATLSTLAADLADVKLGSSIERAGVP